MKLLLKQTRVNNEDALGVAIEFAMILGVFFAAGWALDAALGTVPLFMIVFTVIAAIGLFAKSKYRYDAKMEALEAERLERRAAASPAESPEIR
ncbi:MAG: AtpZ/AtpI family protein [Ilumatobacteraceae bacterium]|jgi:F0F1-type ATP synthase assembly protein I